MLRIAKVFAFLNAVVFMGAFRFMVVKRRGSLPQGWDWAHHEIEGRNGGLILVPRERLVVWPAFIGKHFRLAVKPV